MDWWTAAILGIIQGITEWLPISSSGQTSIVMVGGFGIEPEVAITLGLAIHIGTALAVVAKYPGDIMKMTNPNAGKIQKFYWMVTIISLLCAFPLLILLEATFDSNLWTGETITIFVGLALIITGLILKAGNSKRGNRLATAKMSDWVLLGVAQGFAILPGISRSGMTVSALLMRGYEKTSSMKFSFLLSVPVSFAAAIYFIIFGDVADVGLGAYLIAGVFAFVFGYISMDVLIKIARQINFSKFCMFFGALAVLIPVAFWLL